MNVKLMPRDSLLGWLVLSYWEKAIARIFEIDARIRYVGIVDMGYRVLASEMRRGMTSLTSMEADRNFVSIVPRAMVDGAQKLEPDCGSMQIMTIRYQKVVVAIYRTLEYVVMLSFDPSVDTPFSTQLTEKLKAILH